MRPPRTCTATAVTVTLLAAITSAHALRPTTGSIVRPQAPQQLIRVCTHGGDGACSQGSGKTTLAVLRFLTPAGEVKLCSCSCLARCNRGVAVQLAGTGEIVEQVNGVGRAVALLRSLGFSVEPSLAKAFGASLRGDELKLHGTPREALDEYNHAFALAIRSGLGKSWKRKSTLPRILQPSADAQAPTLALPEEGRELSEEEVLSAMRATGVARVAAARPSGDDGAAPPASIAQVQWLAQLMISRSQVLGALGDRGWRRETRRGLDDALYSVQLAVLLPSLASDTEEAAAANATLASAWERLAEMREQTRDVEGAIYAYERLLALEPPSSTQLSPGRSAKRGMQEIVLISLKRGLESTLIWPQELGKGLQTAAVESRDRLTRRALADAEGLRRLVERDIDSVEAFALSGLNATLPLLVPRARKDLLELRKVAEADINVLQLQILRGDPIFSFLRWVLLKLRAGSQPSPLFYDPSEQTLWLREQFEAGALPNDPALIRSLLAEAKRDPDLVARLITQAKDEDGLDIFTRTAADLPKYV